MYRAPGVHGSATVHCVSDIFCSPFNLSHRPFLAGLSIWGIIIAERTSNQTDQVYLFINPPSAVTLIYRTWLVWGRDRKIVIGLVSLGAALGFPTTILVYSGYKKEGKSMFNTLHILLVSDVPPIVIGGLTLSARGCAFKPYHGHIASVSFIVIILFESGLSDLFCLPFCS